MEKETTEAPERPRAVKLATACLVYWGLSGLTLLACDLLGYWRTGQFVVGTTQTHWAAYVLGLPGMALGIHAAFVAGRAQPTSWRSLAVAGGVAVTMAACWAVAAFLLMVGEA